MFTKFLSFFSRIKLFLFCGLLVAQGVNAQYVTIPDTAFVSWLKNNGFAGCMSGDQMDTTCPAVLNATSVHCNYYPITDLSGIKYFKNLDSLDCTYNDIGIIPALPPLLLYFDCGFNNLMDSLPPLPANLTSLICRGNRITNLPALPVSLIFLNCSYNQISTLITTQTSLTYLDFSFNQVISLSGLPLSLFNINCGNNQLTTLPVLPSILTYLSCAHNQLTSIPDLPDSLFTLECAGNPNLTCLPELKRIINLDFSNTSVACVIDYGNVTNSNPNLDTVPLCDTFDPHSCALSGITNAASGIVFSLSPNPANTYTQVNVNGGEAIKTISITDMLARQLMMLNNAQTNIQISTSSLPAGLYFVELRDEQGRSGVKKLIKE